ncbi:AfsR/SARP family transcriptional regulator [Phytohabitans aurantiacus]|uniref:SARP family transcriptional regulator n=1 Tax=Phytohabitans aurantiacus TaxID=3016789 RepID=A0ABQ5RAZ2_9ACTN|nr:BTAD domain-containing putative transcriptional regulator [Phytohabitans aurantiacus]GLI03583.1 SARP family transcriptional regulator [Phytohabitans aurantiacus]
MGNTYGVGLLGPVEVSVDGVARPVSGLRRKGVLAALSLNAGSVVSADRLAYVIWGDDPPASAVNTLQSHVSYLRRVFGVRGVIVARAPGYVLQVGAEATDVAVAERLIGQARQSSDWATNVSRLRSALGLWRGPALVDVAGLCWLEGQARRLTQLETEARHALVEARLAVGEHVEVVAELEYLIGEQPYHEHLHGQLMLALYRAGRHADALERYQRLRRGLRENLGIDPGPALRDLEAAILRHDAALDAPASAIVVASARRVPSQLPLAPLTFTGRGVELAYLDSILARTAATGEAEPAEPPAVVISAVAGTAGIGKTALALHWAHRVAGGFPDGQLYANLRGFDPGGSVLNPAAALRSFLDALGVPAQRIPSGVDDQASLYRSELAGKRVMVVLDNARDAAQVRPLLPGSPGCLVVVTSRDQLTALVATAGAVPLTLDLLTPAQARDLLAGLVGAGRIAAEPDAVDDIIGRCAGLPLALAITAARAATRPHLPLSALAGELREAADTLDPFHGGDQATDIRAVFSWSYRTLSPAAARLFRLLGLHRGPDITPPAAASLAGVPAPQVRALLAELTGAHLLTEPTPGRYTFHDLLRAYAAEQARSVDDEHTRRTATQRLLDHYLHTAHAAALLLDPFLVPIDPAPAQPGVTIERHHGHDAALSWFDAEQTVLLAAVEQAAEAVLEPYPWQLAWAMTTFLLRRGLWDQYAVAQRTALAAARRLGHRSGQAHALLGLGMGDARSGRFDDADPHLHHALALFEQAGDHVGQAIALRVRGCLSERLNQPADALRDLHRALGLLQTTEHRSQQAVLRNDIGWLHAKLGDYHQAIIHCGQALAVCQELGDRNGQAAIWDSLGYAHRHLGEHQRAITCYRHAVDLYRDLADACNEATVLSHFADTYHDAGQPQAARRAWQDALRIFTRLGHPDSDQVRAKLHQTPP